MSSKVTIVLLSMAVAFAAAAIHSNPNKPVLFGTQRIIPRAAPLKPSEDGTNSTVWGIFDQRQSHSNAQSRPLFPMRYVTNDRFYRRGGPIFLFVGGPWTLEQHFVEQGHFVDIAAENGAFLVANELRYYGESLPVEDATLNNLRLLHVTQALTDLASFIVHVRNNLVKDPNARVILAGVGFSGSLAQWTRKRYPHLVHGVWASGAMFQANTNYAEFAEDVGETIRHFGGDECYSSIFRGFRTAENLIDAGFSKTVNQMFNTCEPIDTSNPSDVEAFFYSLFNEIINQAVNPNMHEDIKQMCESLTDANQPNSLTALSNWLTNRHPQAECLAMDVNSFIQKFQNSDWQSDIHRSGERQWLYQRCTELGWPLTGDSRNQPFGSRFSAGLFQHVCENVFESWLTPDVFRTLIRQTNNFYGGNRPDIRFVYYSYGALDPWRHVGVTSAPYNNTYLSVVPNVFHGEDLASISVEDSEELRRTKEEVAETIRRWLDRRN